MKQQVLPNKTKLAWGIFLVLIVSWSGVLRFYHLGQQSLWMDEGYTVNATTAILENGVSVLDSGKYYHCPLYCYPTAFFVRLLGEKQFVFRLLSAIMGLIFVLVIFFVAKKIFNRPVAVLSTIFTAFSYWQIAWSRQARWYTLLAVFFWLAWYFFYQYLESQTPKPKKKYLVLMLGFTVLAILTHKIAYCIIPAFFIWLALKKYSSDQKLIKYRKPLIIAAILTVLGIALIELITASDFILIQLKNLTLHYKLPFYLNFYLRTYWLFIFFALLAIFETKKTKRDQVYFLLLPVLFYLAVFSFLTDIVHYRYLFPVMPALYILGAVGILNLTKKIKLRWQKFIFILFVLLLFFGSQHGVLLPRTQYFLESDNPEKLHRPYYAYTPQPDFNKAYQFIAEQIQPEEIVISSQPQFNKIFLQQPGYWIKYHYLGFNKKLNTFKNDREYYVGAKVIDDLTELQEIINNHHGFLVWDYMAITDRIPSDIVNYTQDNLEFKFYNQVNGYSKIWVYKF